MVGVLEQRLPRIRNQNLKESIVNMLSDIIISTITRVYFEVVEILPILFTTLSHLLKKSKVSLYFHIVYYIENSFSIYSSKNLFLLYRYLYLDNENSSSFCVNSCLKLFSKIIIFSSTLFLSDRKLNFVSSISFSSVFN